MLAAETARRAEVVSPHHRLILAGMVALYLSDEQAWTTEAQPITDNILAVADVFTSPALLLLRARRATRRTARTANQF